MKKDIIKMFNIQGLLVDSLRTTDRALIISVRSPRVQCACSRCGTMTARIHQYHLRHIKHSIIEEKPVILEVRIRRFLCSPCGKPFTEPIPGIDQRQSTTHFRTATIKALASASITATAQKAGIAPATQTRYLVQAMSEHRIDWHAQGTAYTIGIDEHSYRGRNLLITVTNITRSTLLAVLRNDNQTTLAAFIAAIPDAEKEQIAEVVIDMKSSYRTVIASMLPRARIVVDHFHVIAAANKVIDEVRTVVFSGSGHHPKIVRALRTGKERLSPAASQHLQSVFTTYRAFPDLRVAYEAKEKLRDVYRAATKQEAVRRFRMLLIYLQDTRSQYLNAWRRTLVRWQPLILNYFNQRSTNAFTEGCHTKIKMVKRVSFGFRNLTNYIAKVMLAFVPLLWIVHHTN